MFGGTVSAVDNIRCHDSFMTVVVDNALDSRVKDYVEPIKATKRFVRDRTISRETLRRLSDLWIGLARKGKISQVYPGYYGESLIDGPKSDIFMTCTGLANRISEIAEIEDYEQDKNAMSDAIRSIELIDIVRFGSYESLFTASGYLRRPLKTLRPNLDSLSPEERTRLARVQNTKTREYKIQLLEERVHHLRVQYATRYGDDMTKQDDPTYKVFATRTESHLAAEHFYGFDRELTVQLAPNK